MNLSGTIYINSAINDNSESDYSIANITGGVLTLGENDIIKQDKLNISEGVSFSTDADKLQIADGIGNEGTLTFTGGENTNVVEGEGGKTVIAGEVENFALINQNIDVNTHASLTSDLSYVGGNIATEGAIVLNGDETQDSTISN